MHVVLCFSNNRDTEKSAADTGKPGTAEDKEDITSSQPGLFAAADMYGSFNTIRRG